MKNEEEIKEEYRQRLRDAKNGKVEEDLDEQAMALAYEVGRAHGAQFENFVGIGWKTVLDLKEEIKDE